MVILQITDSDPTTVCDPMTNWLWFYEELTVIQILSELCSSLCSQWLHQSLINHMHCSIVCLQWLITYLQPIPCFDGYHVLSSSVRPIVFNTDIPQCQESNYSVLSLLLLSVHLFSPNIPINTTYLSPSISTTWPKNSDFLLLMRTTRSPCELVSPMRPTSSPC